MSNPLAIEFPTEEGNKMKDAHGIPCVARHGPLPPGNPVVDLVRCERDAEGDPHPSNFSPWRCYSQPPLHSRFAFNYTLRCFMTKDGTPYTNDPRVHAVASQVCCSVRYGIRMNARWNGLVFACLVQICLTVLSSAIFLAMQYVSRSSHPLTRLIKERWFFGSGNPFPDTQEPMSAAVDIPLSHECSPLVFVCAYFLFNLVLFIVAIELLIKAPYAPDLLLVSVIISLGLVFLLSTCALMMALARFNARTYRWIKRATSKRHQPRKPDFELGPLAGALSRRTGQDQQKNAEDAV